MSILVADIISRCAAQVDAEGSDFYTFTEDYLPAILSAQDWVVSVINSQLGKKKFSEEIFSDLRIARVFQASNFSRIRLDPALLGHSIWTLTSIEPLPITDPTFIAQVLPAPQDSKYRNDLTHVSSNFYAQRTSDEEWAKNKNNPFHDSHAGENGETPSSYGYLDYTDYTSSAYTLTAPAQEIEVRPAIANQPVTIRYIRVPSKPTATSDSLQFPVFAFDIIVSATLSFLAVKQGDQTTLESLSTRFLSQLILPNQ